MMRWIMTKSEKAFTGMFAVLMVFVVINTAILFMMHTEYELKSCKSGCVVSKMPSQDIQEFLSHGV